MKIAKMEPVLEELEERYEDPSFSQSYEVFPDRAYENAKKGLDSIIFVDGKRRSFVRLMTTNGYVGVFSEVSAAAVLWSRKMGTKPLFSPRVPPKVVKVVGFSKDYPEEGEEEKVDDLTFKVVKTGRDAMESVDNELKALEAEVVRERLRDGVLVVRDGPAIPDHVFEPGVGPIGLIKNVMLFGLPRDQLEELSRLRKGERWDKIYCERKGKLKRVGTYLKLIDEEGLRGIVKVESFVDEDWKIEELSKLFNELAVTLPSLTADLPIPRLPEDIFPIQFLEQQLSHFLTDRNYMITKILAFHRR